MADNTFTAPAPKMDRKISRPWWQKRAPLLIVVAVAIVVGAGLLYLTLPAPGTVTASADAMETGTVTRGEFQDYVPLRSTVVPLEITYITAISGGQVGAISAQDGDLVAPGQELARLANPDLTLQVASKEAEVSGQLSNTNSQMMSLRNTRADRDQAMSDALYALHKAEETLKKYERLRDQGVVNDAGVKPYADEAGYQRDRVAALKKAQASDDSFFASQGQQIDASANDLRRSLSAVRQGLEALTIRAPIAGRLTGFDLKPGQAVKPGDTLAEVDSDNAWKLSAEVDEFYLARLSPGLKAVATVHGQETGVHITRVYPQVHDGHITVEMQFDGAMPQDLKRGEAIDVRLSLGKSSEAILAPGGSWIGDTNGTYAFVLNQKGDRADRRAISTGRRNPDQVEVLSGLKPGERIIVAPLTDYTRAKHIRLSQKKSS
ncbi:MAG: efflux RND transporter periplasmic adaptor subunit [Asticcacaulis sp.]|uniref:efflux RND transporter periplasmic adaptor subunit n=1 Tax=Asticcacaulis sp. TaxID=1872648 RepID=UPI0039E22ECD